MHGTNIVVRFQLRGDSQRFTFMDISFQYSFGTHSIRRILQRKEIVQSQIDDIFVGLAPFSDACDASKMHSIQVSAVKVDCVIQQTMTYHTPNGVRSQNDNGNECSIKVKIRLARQQMTTNRILILCSILNISELTDGKNREILEHITSILSK